MRLLWGTALRLDARLSETKTSLACLTSDGFRLLSLGDLDFQIITFNNNYNSSGRYSPWYSRTQLTSVVLKGDP